MQLLSQLLNEFVSASATAVLDKSPLFDRVQHNWPKLAKQIKFAWAGDARDAEKGRGYDDFIMPKLLKYDSIKKYEPDFPHTNETRKLITDLYDLFRETFKIPSSRKWFMESNERTDYSEIDNVEELLSFAEDHCSEGAFEDLMGELQGLHIEDEEDHEEAMDIIHKFLDQHMSDY